MTPALGFFGKLPARGDFVRSGLPRDFVDAWDAWWQRGIAATRDAAAEDWVAAWLEAPVWRFRLPPGVCGAGAVLGAWMPSVDRAGRYFPLTVAAVGPPATLTDAAAGGFLAAAEGAALDALQYDEPPETLGRRLAAAYGAGDPVATPPAEPGHSLWWTEGGPRVAPAVVAAGRLPEGAAFAAMLDGVWVDAERWA